MIRDKLLDILPVVIAGSVLLLAIIVATNNKEPQKEKEKIRVVWNHSNGSNSNEADANFDYVVYNSSNKVSEEESQKQWVETDDKNLINYANKTTKLSSSNWTLSGVSYTDYSAPNEVKEVREANAKTYMKFQTLGYDSWNRQGHLARQKEAYTGKYSLRMIDNRIMIAVGSHYCTTIGTYIDVLLEDGTVIPCIMGDAKSDRHTDSTNRYQKYDKSVIEFIVDSPGKNRKDYSYFKKKYPDIASGNFSATDEFSSLIIGLRVYDKVYNIDMSDMSNDNPDGR